MFEDLVMVVTYQLRVIGEDVEDKIQTWGDLPCFILFRAF